MGWFIILQNQIFLSWVGVKIYKVNCFTYLSAWSYNFDDRYDSRKRRERERERKKIPYIHGWERWLTSEEGAIRKRVREGKEEERKKNENDRERKRDEGEGAL